MEERLSGILMEEEERRGGKMAPPPPNRRFMPVGVVDPPLPFWIRLAEPAHDAAHQ